MKLSLLLQYGSKLKVVSNPIQLDNYSAFHLKRGTLSSEYDIATHILQAPK